MDIQEEALYLEIKGCVEDPDLNLPLTDGSNPSLEEHETVQKIPESLSEQTHVDKNSSKIDSFSPGDEDFVKKLNKDRTLKFTGNICKEELSINKSLCLRQDTINLDNSKVCQYVPVSRSRTFSGVNETTVDYYETSITSDLPLGQSEKQSADKHQCIPCKSEGKIIFANAYCETCEEDLCDDCFKVHRIPTPMKNHVVKYENKKIQAGPHGESKTKNQCTLACPTHENKYIEFFCLVHDAPVCGICVVFDHKSCNVQLITDMAQGYQKSFEFKALLQSLENLDLNITKIDNHTSIDVIEKMTADLLDDIRKARNELNACCDLAETELTEAITSMAAMDKADIEFNLKKKNLLKTDINEARCKLQTQHQEDLFVTAKLVSRQMPKFHETFAEYLSDSKTRYYAFTRGNFFDDILKSRNPFGAIERTYKAASELYEDLESLCTTEETYASVKNTGLETEAVIKCHEINVAHKSDTEDTWITGIAVLPNNTILLVDQNNLSVKKVEDKATFVSESLLFISEPWDITTIPSDRAAITLPYEKRVVILLVKSGIKIFKTLKVNGKCHGIDSVEDKLIVSFTKPSKVELLDQTGNVINILIADELGNPLFVSPNYVFVSSEDLDSMYLSDFARNTVTKLSLKGKVISKLSFKEWNGLFGITVAEDEQIIVCNYWNDSIDVVSKDGKRHVLLDPSDGIKKPRAVYYCSTRKLLLVSANVENALVTVFQFH